MISTLTELNIQSGIADRLATPESLRSDARAWTAELGRGQS